MTVVHQSPLAPAVAGSSSAASTIAGGLADGVELGGREPVNEQAPDHGDVPWCGGLDVLAAAFGDDDVGTAPIGVALLLLHQPPIGHPSDVVESRLFSHPSTPASSNNRIRPSGAVGERHEDEVVRVRQP